VLGPAGVPLELAALRQSRALIRLGLRSSAHTEGFAGAGSDSGSDCSEVQAAVFMAGVVREWLRVRPTFELGVLSQDAGHEVATLNCFQSAEPVLQLLFAQQAGAIAISEKACGLL
jgi:hypothetical protein